MVSKLLTLLTSVAFGAHGGRLSRKRAGAGLPGSKFIAGIPILNYDKAYAGVASMATVESGKLQGEWVVVMKSSTHSEQIKALCTLVKCTGLGNPTEGGSPMFEMTGTEDDLERVLKAGSSNIRFVEPDSEVSIIEELPEVQAIADIWGLKRIGADQRANEGAGTHVYVLDTGIRVTHREFGGRAVPTLDAAYGNVKECNGDVRCAADKQGHGTHCAGTAVGATFGVAPGAQVHAVKVLSDEGKGEWSWTYKALDWVGSRAERPAVASMSLGGRGIFNAMKVSVDSAVNAGVTVVVAGGNENGDACTKSPAFVPSAITVGSTSSSDTRSYFSNYGYCVDMYAPGSKIMSAQHTSDDGSKVLSGTSMACPHVAGAVALLIEGTTDGRAGDTVLDSLKANGIWNGISQLNEGDTDVLLYVGADGPPPTPAPVPTPAPTPPPPTPAPLPEYCDPAWGTGPDWSGDCRCKKDYRCHQGGEWGCEASNTPLYGKLSVVWYNSQCQNCECIRQ